MKSKNNQHVSPAMVENKATEKLKKRLQDMGLIVNASEGRGTKQPSKKTGKK